MSDQGTMSHADSTEFRIAKLEKNVANVNADVADLMNADPPTQLFTTVPEPTIRVRINHKRTSTGWRLDETTVEWSGVGSPNWSRIDAELAMTHKIGLVEAQARNNAIAADAE